MGGLAPASTARLDAIASAYNQAFEAVQEHLKTVDLGKVPAWVFGIDRFDIVELARHDTTLARLEQKRRQWRAALHAMVELAALTSREPLPMPHAATTLDPETFSESGDLEATVEADSNLPALDRFISVVQYARSAGCMYVDGGFAPVEKGRKR